MTSPDLYPQNDNPDTHLDPVFFVSCCGKNSAYTSSLMALGAEEENDPKRSSVGAAVEFARINNLLGVFVDADLLVSQIIFVGTAGSQILVLGPSSISDPWRPERWTSGRYTRGLFNHTRDRGNACRRIFW